MKRNMMFRKSAAALHCDQNTHRSLCKEAPINFSDLPFFYVFEKRSINVICWWACVWLYEVQWEGGRRRKIHLPKCVYQTKLLCLRLREGLKQTGEIHHRCCIVWGYFVVNRRDWKNRRRAQSPPARMFCVLVSVRSCDWDRAWQFSPALSVWLIEEGIWSRGLEESPETSPMLPD